MLSSPANSINRVSLSRRHAVTALAGAAVHECLELIEVVRINGPRQAIPLRADRSRHPHDLAHAATCTHYPHGPECLVRNADIAPGQKQVRHVATVETAVRRPVRSLVDVVLVTDGRPRDKLLALARSHKTRVGRVQVDTPRAGEASILELPILAEVVASEHYVAEQPARLALTGNVRRPLQPMVRIPAV